VAPDVPIVGPGAYSQAWWGPFAEAKLPQPKIFSYHYYPLYDCKGTFAKAKPTLSNMISRYAHDRTIEYDAAALKVAKEHGLETWLVETGQSACPGSNETTKTHASALWSADFFLNTLQQGVTRIAYHSSLLTCTGGPPMSPICSGGPYLQPDGSVQERANYFGLSMVASLGTGKFLKLEQAGGGLSFAYALKHADGSTSVIVANENDPAKDAQTEVTLSLPGKPKKATMTQMAGPSFAAVNATVVDGAPAAPVPDAKRPTVMDFVEGSEVQKFPLTAGTVTVLHFTY
jgi:hypothetical protein